MADDFKLGPFSQIVQGARARAGAGGRFAGRTGMIMVAVELDKVGVLRNPDGTLTAMQGHMRDANAKLAEELAQATADEFKKRSKRPGVSSGRLQAALLNDRNRASDAFGYGVGSPEYLDSSQAKYWRQIDQGFGGHRGRAIMGVWGSTLTGDYRVSPANPSPGYPIAGPVFTGMGAKGENQGRLRPFGYSKLRKGMGKQRSTRGIIRKAIAPEEYFKRGWESFDAKKRTTEVVREEISRAFGGQGVPTPAYLASLRQGPKSVGPPSPGKRFR